VARPDGFPSLALLLASVRVRPAIAALIGLGDGIVADLAHAGIAGAAADCHDVRRYLASWLKAVFFADNLVLNAFFFFLGKWLFDVIYFVVEQRVGGIELVQQLLLWSPLVCGCDRGAGVVLLLIMRPMLEPTPHELPSERHARERS
jgi:rod shape-determining protein MreD